MFFITVNKKIVGIVVFAIILCLMALCAYSLAMISESKYKYESVITITKMFDDTHFIAFMTNEMAQNKGKEVKNIEVFDIAKGEVILSKPLNHDIQNEVFNYINTVKDLYAKVMPFPEKGYVIRVPFEPPRNVDVPLLNETGIKSVDSVFIILSDKEAPIMLILDSKLRPLFYTFNSGIDPLLEYLDLKLEYSTMMNNEAEQE